MWWAFFTVRIRLKKPEPQKSARGLGAQDAGFEVKAWDFWTPDALLLKNA